MLTEKQVFGQRQRRPYCVRKNLNDTPKKPLRGEVIEPIKPEAIVALLTENGNMDTVALASAVGRDPRGLASNLCLMAKRGHIKKIGQGKGVKWGLPDETEITPEPVFAELPEIEITPKVAIPSAGTETFPREHPCTEKNHLSQCRSHHYGKSATRSAKSNPTCKDWRNSV